MHLLLWLICCILYDKATSYDQWTLPPFVVDPRCLFVVARGPCKGNYKTYGYDPYSQRCGIFMYSGCGGNPNRFKSETDCVDTCSPHKSPDDTYDDYDRDIDIEANYTATESQNIIDSENEEGISEPFDNSEDNTDYDEASWDDGHKDNDDEDNAEKKEEMSTERNEEESSSKIKEEIKDVEEFERERESELDSTNEHQNEGE